MVARRGDRGGYLPLSSGFTPAGSPGSSFVRALLPRRKATWALLFFTCCVCLPLYLLGPRLLGDEQIKKLGLEEYWSQVHPPAVPPPPSALPPHPEAAPVAVEHPPPPPQAAPAPAAHFPPIPPSHVPMPWEDASGAVVSSKIPALHASNFPAEYASSQPDFAKLYPDGDPHVGVIPQALLALIEDTLPSQPPTRPPPAAEIPAHLYKPHDWDAARDGSRTTFADTPNAGQQPLEPDFREGTRFAGWQPPLAELGADKPGPPLPRVQHAFAAPGKHSGRANDPQRDEVIRRRQKLVRNAFIRSWEGYKKYAWGHDELKPVSNGFADPFNGWGASIVDALDTILIMDLPDEYNYARQHVRDIDFLLVAGERSAYGGSDGRIPVFETAIRYLGGLLSAYDLSGDTLMRDRAEELGQIIAPAFHTSSGVPVGRLKPGSKNVFSSGTVILSEATSMLLEYTRLWQVTGNRTYFDYVQRATDWIDKKLSSTGRLGSLLPTLIGPESDVKYGAFSFGGMADSYYEYLIKQYQLLGGRLEQYKRMYSAHIADARKYLFSVTNAVPHTPLLLVGIRNGNSYAARFEHLACFSGAMVGLGARLLPERESAGDMHDAMHLTETCYWAYNSTRTGIGPEDVTFYKPDEHFRPGSGAPQVGVKSNNNADYRNRPETIESIFYMWRITGDEQWQERGWQMFCSWVTHSMTPSGFSGIDNVHTVPSSKTDSMESFAFAETFKYYYLLFSPPELISLDNYVFTTEAHPLLVPKNGQWTAPDGGPRKFWDAKSADAQKLALQAEAAGGGAGGAAALPYLGGENAARPGQLTNVQKHAVLRTHRAKRDAALAQAVGEALRAYALAEVAESRGGPLALAALRRDPQALEAAIQAVTIDIARTHTRQVLLALIDAASSNAADAAAGADAEKGDDADSDAAAAVDARTVFSDEDTGAEARLDRALVAYAHAQHQHQQRQAALAAVADAAAAQQPGQEADQGASGGADGLADAAQPAGVRFDAPLQQQDASDALAREEAHASLLAMAERQQWAAAQQQAQQRQQASQQQDRQAHVQQEQGEQADAAVQPDAGTAASAAPRAPPRAAHLPLPGSGGASGSGSGRQGGNANANAAHEPRQLGGGFGGGFGGGRRRG